VAVGGTNVAATNAIAVTPSDVPRNRELGFMLIPPKRRGE
jgi:hypothetical protein